MNRDVLNPAYIDPSLDARAITFENLTGARGAGGTAHHGRKGAPNRRLQRGERLVLADIDGPGVIRHIWLTFMPAPPEVMRALWFEVFYDGNDEPSISVPVLDFFGLPHGRPVAYHSQFMQVNEGRGFNSYLPMPFRQNCRIEVVNDAPRSNTLYSQVDYTLEPEFDDTQGYLHVSWRRQNPTVQKDDFVITEGLRGPGRFLGCNVGVRVIDPADWYGEGEVKIYKDGDDELPTICGTGLEDYVLTAWGLDAHHMPHGGAPLVVKPTENPGPNPDFVGFYRWHLHDPVMFERDLKVTIQQIGAKFFPLGAEAELAAYEQTNPPAGEGWITDISPMMLAWGLAERVDDYCATAYVYCREPQGVPRLSIADALVDIERKPYEVGNPMEMMAAIMEDSGASAPLTANQ